MTKTFLRSWKPVLAFLSVILLAGGLGSQSPQTSVNASAASSGYTIKWIRTFGNFFGITPDMKAADYNEFSECGGAVETGDGGLVMVGTAVFFPPAGSCTQDLIVMEVRPSGEVDWELAYECAPGEDTWYSGVGIARCPDGDYLVTGQFNHLNASAPIHGYHPVLLKVSPRGGLRWIKLLGVGSPAPDIYDDCGAPVPVADGGFLLAGNTPGLGSWIIRMDGAGRILWCKNYTPGLGSPHPTSDGGFVLTGGDGSNGLVVKCSSSGGIQWRRALAQDPGWGCDDLATQIDGITPTSDGGFLLIGNTTACNCCHDGQANYWMAKLDASGRILWKKGAHWAQNVFPTRDGGFVLQEQYCLMKFSASGAFQWRRNVDSQTTLYWAFEGGDGGFVATGSTFPPNAGYSVMAVMRLNSSGKIDNCDRITSSFVGPSGTGIHSVSAASISVRSRSVWMKSLPVRTISRSCEVETLCNSFSLRHVPSRAPVTDGQGR